MWRGRKIIAVTPAGRRKYMDVLKRNLERYVSVLDEWHVWKNTTNPDDVEYINQLGSMEFVRVIECPVGVNGNMSICSFFQFCDDPDAVYVRFDDDVIALDSLDAFQKFLDFRIDNPRYPVVYANILNNAISTWIHQRRGSLPGKTGYECMDPVAWGCPEFAKTLHDAILDKPLESFRFPGTWTFLDRERVSINCISWLGRLEVPFECDEEKYISCVLPENEPNCMFGGYCVVHFAFGTQREELERAGYLDKYARQTKEIVVARYAEDVDWIREYLPLVDRVTIYDKNDKNDFVSFDHPKIRVVRLPNVGREAHTYVHHFAQNDLCDVVVCTQGRFSDHVSPSEFRSVVDDDTVVARGKVHDKLDVPPDSTIMAHFGYTERQNHAGSTPMVSAGMTMREYYTTYISDVLPASFAWVEGAIFKTNASKIRRFPVDTYEKIRETLEMSKNPEAAYIMERFWGMVF